MPETFILIPGRTSRQGTGLNEGKYSADYQDEINTLLVHPGDMVKLGVKDGDRVRMWNENGSVTVGCKSAKEECPPGLAFISYGDKSSQLMDGETHGSGMPTSKGMEVFVEKIEGTPPV